MDDDMRAELRLLQARAFGPAADIDQDPAAVNRLRELEYLARTRPPASTFPVEDAPVADPATLVPPVADPAPATPPRSASPTHVPVVEPPVPSTPRKPRRPRRPRARPLSRWLLVIWIVTVIIAAAWAGGATYGLAKISPVAVSHGAPQIATLTPTEAVDLPTGWFGAGASSKVYEFYGLVLFETGGGGFGASGGTDCFTVVAADDLPDEDDDTTTWSASLMYSACRMGAFPAAVSLTADSSVPEELRDRYPGAALQFVRDGDRIGVFLDAA